MINLIKQIEHFLYPQIGKVFMLHRVTNEISLIGRNRLYEVTPAFLEQTILDYQSLGCRFVSIQEISEMVGKCYYPKEKFICFTLDDGYLDNYVYAYPIFKKYQVPFCVYVSSGLVEGNALPWQYMLEKLVISSTRKDREELFFHMRQSICRKNMSEQLVWFKEHNFDDVVPKMMMGKKEIRTISKDPLCTIGCHTVSHCYLRSKSQSDIYCELMDCKKYLEVLIGRDVTHFSYPYGDYNQVVKTVVEECGFKSATTTAGVALRRNCKSVFEIPRVTLIQFPLQ